MLIADRANEDVIDHPGDHRDAPESAFEPEVQESTSNPRMMKITTTVAVIGLLPGIGSAVVLIDAFTNNGGFELVSGATGSTAKVEFPSGTIDNWSVFTASFDSSTDFGTDDTAPGGTRESFFRADSSVSNTLIGQTIRIGDVFDYSVDWVEAGRGEGFVALGYFDGAQVVEIPGTRVTSTTLGTFGGNYAASGAEIGNDISLIVGASDGANYPELDNAFLEVVPEPSVALLGGLGLFGLMRRSREA